MTSKTKNKHNLKRTQQQPDEPNQIVVASKQYSGPIPQPQDLQQ